MHNRELDQKQIIVISLISILLLAAAIGADIWMKAEAQTQQEAAQKTAEATPSDAVPAYQYARISSRLTEIVEDSPYEPGPSVLNLAYYYPDGADTSDVMNSYAGQLYTKLMQREAAYMAAIYDLGDEQPLHMATQLGFEKNRVLGKYNPTDAAQNPADPASWVIGRFKNINIAFYDGDGNRINGYSTVKEILAMASVYTYYHDMMDAQAMESYAMALWDRSHTRKVSMSGVYYDSGCLNRSIAEEAAEAVAQEQQQAALENTLATGTARSAGDAELAVQQEVATFAPLPSPNATSGAANSGTETASTSPASVGYVAGGPGDTAAGQNQLSDGMTSSGAETASTNGLSANGISANGAAENTPSATGTSGNGSSAIGGTSTTGTTGGAVGTISGTNSGTGTTAQTAPLQENPVISNVPAQADNASVQTSASTEAGVAKNRATGMDFSNFSRHENGESQELLGYQGADMTVAAQAVNGPTFFGGEEASASPQNPANNQTQPQESAANTETTNAQTAVSSAEANDEQTPVTTAGSVAVEEGATLAPLEQANTDASLCPGHIDLYITVTLKGIDDATGLIQEDVIGNNPDNFNENWQGWTEDRLKEVRALNAEDWFTKYGLTISAINIGTPLTQEQISSYLALLPAELSQKRRDIIHFALQSVGKVPYYWGGKPYGPNYERNSFGTLIAPDTKGRILRGLDCSGWINWVYWSVTGQELAGESTGTLIGCGRRINRGEMQPGDIMVRTGPDAHVVMFLAWAANGNMIVVHETGGVTNNVVVSEFAADWPYYRALAD